MHLLRSVTWQWLTASVVGCGLLAGGIWYGYAQGSAGRVLAQEAPAATATSATPPQATESAQTTAPADAAAPGVAASPAPAAKPAAVAAKPAAKPNQNTNSRRPMGEVVAITPDPGAFTIRTAAGEQQTFRVLQTTVFAAGRDRPYRFELLKVGDSVTVAAGGMGQGAGANAGANATGAANAGAPKPGASPVPKPAGATARAAAKPNGAARNARATAQASGEIVARQVLVRPAGEAARPGAGPGEGTGQGARKKAGGQPTGVNNATGQ